MPAATSCDWRGIPAMYPVPLLSVAQPVQRTHARGRGRAPQAQLAYVRVPASGLRVEEGEPGDRLAELRDEARWHRVGDPRHACAAGRDRWELGERAEAGVRDLRQLAQGDHVP